MSLLNLHTSTLQMTNEKSNLGSLWKSNTQSSTHFQHQYISPKAILLEYHVAFTTVYYTDKQASALVPKEAFNKR